MGEDQGALLVSCEWQWETIWEPLESFNPELRIMIQNLPYIEPNHAMKLPKNSDKFIKYTFYAFLSLVFVMFSIFILFTYIIFLNFRYNKENEVKRCQ